MPTSEAAKQQEKPPTYEALMEEKFARDLCAAIRAWREAGKPHKR